MSPQAYRIAARMEDAKRLLESGSMPLKEISARLGYASQLYFSSDFKRRFGLSPKAYRVKEACRASPLEKSSP